MGITGGIVSLALEEKYDQVRQLINMGKERGYLLYDEVNDLLPAEIHSSEEIDDLLSTFERYGIDVYEDLSSAKAALAGDGAEVEVVKEESPADDSELDLTPGSLEKTNDPVRMYLREMGTVPLLTREGEVAIAKRIERGQLVVMKAISRSPIVIREIVGLGEDLRRGVRNIKEVVTFDEEEITDEILQNRLKEFTGKIDDLAKAYKKANQLLEKFAAVSQKKRPKDYRRYRIALARAIVDVSLCVRNLAFTNHERKRLIDRVHKTVD